MKKEEATKLFLPSEDKDREILLGETPIKEVPKEEEKKQMLEGLNDFAEKVKKDKVLNI